MITAQEARHRREFFRLAHPPNRNPGARLGDISVERLVAALSLVPPSNLIRNDLPYQHAIHKDAMRSALGRHHLHQRHSGRP